MVTSNLPFSRLHPMDLLQLAEMRWKSNVWVKRAAAVTHGFSDSIPFCLQTEFAVNVNQMQTRFIKPFFQLPICSL